jgi:hypothetical protein
MDRHVEVQVLLQAVETECAQAGGRSSLNDKDLPPYTPQQVARRSNEPSERGFIFFPAIHLTIHPNLFADVRKRVKAAFLRRLVSS